MDLNGQIRCIDLEIKRRERIFPKLIETNKMTQEYADREIEGMKAVRRTLVKTRGLSNQKFEHKPRNGQKAAMQGYRINIPGVMK